MSGSAFTRRHALQSLLSLPGMACLRADELTPSAIPIAELVNVYEMRDQARRKLSSDEYAAVSGTERGALERITFRPRLMVNVSQLDLTTELFGEKLFAPIIIGPMANLQTYHPDGELAMLRGASASKSLMIVSGGSSRKLPEIVAEAKTPLWFQAYPDPDIDVTIAAAREAVQAGCRAVCLTVGIRPAGNAKLDWATVARMKRSIKAPLVLKGILNAEDARAAIANGVDGMVVSNHGGMYAAGIADPVEILPSVVEAVSGKAPVLVDGGFRRGTDILKALALGARAVLLGRPPVWGLAAYGAEGVQAVMEMLQTELARNMAMCGKPDLKSIDRSLIRIHRR